MHSIQKGLRSSLFQHFDVDAAVCCRNTSDELELKSFSVWRVLSKALCVSSYLGIVDMVKWF